MAKFTVNGRNYEIERLWLGEIKAIARVLEKQSDGSNADLYDRCARVVAAATARFGDGAFVYSETAECSVSELTTASSAILVLGGFVAGEATAAALETPQQ